MMIRGARAVPHHCILRITGEGCERHNRLCVCLGVTGLMRLTQSPNKELFHFDEQLWKVYTCCLCAVKTGHVERIINVNDLHFD